MTFLPHATLVALLVFTTAPALGATPILEVSNSAEIAARFDERSSVRVLNIWATWCAPCVAEMPALQSIHADYQSRGVSLVAVSMDNALPGSREEARERVAKFIAAESITFPSVLYVGTLPTIESELRLSGEIPVTIVFDARGQELSRIEGILEDAKFRSELDRLLSSKRQPPK